MAFVAVNVSFHIDLMQVKQQIYQRLIPLKLGAASQQEEEDVTADHSTHEAHVRGRWRS